jgi:hypothetical protein
MSVLVCAVYLPGIYLSGQDGEEGGVGGMARLN